MASHQGEISKMIALCPLDHQQKPNSWDEGSLTTSSIRPQWCTLIDGIVHPSMLDAFNAGVLSSLLLQLPFSLCFSTTFFPKVIQFAQFLMEGFVLYYIFRNKHTMKPTKLGKQKMFFLPQIRFCYFSFSRLLITKNQTFMTTQLFLVKLQTF